MEKEETKDLGSEELIKSRISGDELLLPRQLSEMAR